ncbi:hypothetical protein GP486_005210, partial [Trichoglossum hirsutum]
MSSRDIENEIEKGQAFDHGSPSSTPTLCPEGFELSCQKKGSFSLVLPGFLKHKNWATWPRGIFTSPPTNSSEVGGSNSTKIGSPEANDNGGGNPDGNTVIRKLEDCPEGYPRLAALLDSDESFMIYRRFGFLHARVLLNKQDELRELEDQLDAKDKEDEGQRVLKSRVRDDKTAPAEGARGPTRKQILAEIETKLNEYDKLLTNAQNLAGFNRPAGRDYRSVKHYMDNTKPLVRREAQFIRKKEDFITLKPGRDGAWLDYAVERLLKHVHCRLVEWVFCNE